MTINKPYIETQGDFVIVYSDVEIEEKKERLWYKFPVKFRDFIVDENVDAFLVGLLFLALKNGEDIYLEGPVSARLEYSLNKYLISALCLANPELNVIKVHARELNFENLNKGDTAGTGLSCGVDSFTTYYSHLQEKGCYKIGYFTFFNAGSLGDLGGKNSREIFRKKFTNVENFANEERLEVIPIDTNLSDLLLMNFQSTHTLRNLSCVLHLQKLFRTYYYASPHRFDMFNLNKKDTGDYDLLTLHLLSTESTNFFSAAADLTRIERTDFISGFPLTYKYLDVCTNPHEKGKFLNCTRCHKCMRTAFTLDLLGKLFLYKEVFDIKEYYLQKPEFLGKMIGTAKEDLFNQELLKFARERDENFNRNMIYLFNYKFQKLKSGVKRTIKNFLH